MKTNFRKSEDDSSQKHNDKEIEVNQKDLTQEEFEEFISKSGAKGSFMIYRSAKKDEELGLDEL
jgi:hypothetical protein|tara:strand:- start:1875 stop:2066 length:192 start_codon:yes stop_codon:yes gene_type:complete